MTNQVSALEISQKSNSKKHKKNPRSPQGNSRGEVPLSQIESQLSNLFNRTRSKDTVHNNVADLGEEGVDHINLDRNSKTKLGFLLSMQANIPFTLYGVKFSSIDNLMLYYKFFCTIREASFANHTGKKALREEHEKNFPRFASSFPVVCLAYAELFKNNPVLLEAYENNNLPYDQYYMQNNVRTRSKIARFLVKAINVAFHAVKKNVRPELSEFIENDTLAHLREKYDGMEYRENFTFNDFLFNHFNPKNVREFYFSTHKPEEYKVIVAKREENKAKQLAKHQDELEQKRLAAVVAQEAALAPAAAAPVELTGGVVDTSSTDLGDVPLQPEQAIEQADPEVDAVSVTSSGPEGTVTNTTFAPVVEDK